MNDLSQLHGRGRLCAQLRDSRFLPFILSFLVIVLDQVTKAWVVQNLDPVAISGDHIEVFGEFLRIIHTRNPGIAFSIGSELPEMVRNVAFTAIPVMVLAGLLFYYFRYDPFYPAQRWAVSAIVGGGIGNIIDRVTRTGGVVDFIDVEFFGIFGLERWPTFNVADAAVVVGGVLLIAGILIEEVRTNGKES